MSEVVIPHYEDDPVVDSLVIDALSMITAKYGPYGISPRSYHGPRHTVDVIESVESLADAAVATGNIVATDKRLLIIAAAYHDIEQDLGSLANESASAFLAEDMMRESASFSEDDQHTVVDAIVATVVHFDGDGRMRQSATEDYRTQLLADADLASLGRPTELYWDRAKALFHELHPDSELDSEQGDAFIASQAAFIASHLFYTPEARELFPNKERNTSYVRSLAFRHH